jgi:hypothetical protein
MVTASFEERSIIAGDFVPELRLRKEGAVKPAESLFTEHRSAARS